MKIIEAAKKVIEELHKDPLNCTVDQAQAIFKLKQAIEAHDARIEANRLRKLDNELEENELINTKP